MKLALWIHGGLAATLVLTMVPVLALGLPTFSVIAREHQDRRLTQVVAKTIQLDRASQPPVTGRFSMNQQLAVEVDPGVATLGAACGRCWR